VSGWDSCCMLIQECTEVMVVGNDVDVDPEEAHTPVGYWVRWDYEH